MAKPEISGTTPPPPGPPAPEAKFVPVELMPPAGFHPGAADGPPPENPAGLSRRQLALAFAVAGLSDTISLWTNFLTPVQLVVDALTAVALFMILGWRWVFLPALIMEAMPGVALFPLWVLVVGSVAVMGTARPGMN